MVKRLWLARLALTDFRNYTQTAFTLEPHSVVLSGANGAGKTNVLEAVSILVACPASVGCDAVPGLMAVTRT